MLSIPRTFFLRRKQFVFYSCRTCISSAESRIFLRSGCSRNSSESLLVECFAAPAGFRVWFAEDVAVPKFSNGSLATFLGDGSFAVLELAVGAKVVFVCPFYLYKPLFVNWHFFVSPEVEWEGCWFLPVFWSPFFDKVRVHVHRQ